MTVHEKDPSPEVIVCPFCGGTIFYRPGIGLHNGHASKWPDDELARVLLGLMMVVVLLGAIGILVLVVSKLPDFLPT